jgi:hypothetical protein
MLISCSSGTPGPIPNQALVSSPADVRLVIVGGIPIYGDRDLLGRLIPARQLFQADFRGA